MKYRFILLAFILFGCQSGKDQRNSVTKNNDNLNQFKDANIIQHFIIDSLNMELYPKTSIDFLKRYVYNNDSFFNWDNLKIRFLKKYSAHEVDSIKGLFYNASEKFSRFYTLNTIRLTDSCNLHIILHEYFSSKYINALCISISGELMYTLKIAEELDTQKGLIISKYSALYKGNFIRIIEQTVAGGDVDFGYPIDTKVDKLVSNYRLSCKSIELLK